MFCPRCLSESFEYVDNVIPAGHVFRGRERWRSPDIMPGPSMRCCHCGLTYKNLGTHLETVEPDLAA